MSFDLADLKNALEETSFDLNSMLSVLTEIEHDILYTKPTVKAYSHWELSLYGHSFPKKRKGWMNLIRTQFGKLKIYLPKAQVKDYIDRSYIPLEMRNVLRKIAEGDCYSEDDHYIVKVQTDPERIYDELVKRRFIIPGHYKKVHRGFMPNRIKDVLDGDSSLDDFEVIKPTKKIRT